MTPGIRFRPISSEAAAALAAGRLPDDVRVARDHPTESSTEMGMGGPGAPLGPYFMHRVADDVVDEIGGGFVDDEDDEHDGVPMREREF